MFISFFVYISFALATQREPHFHWNIGCVGSLTQIVCIGHVHFMLFMSISFASGTQRKPVFQWNMGLSVWLQMYVKYLFYFLSHICVNPYVGKSSLSLHTHFMNHPFQTILEGCCHHGRRRSDKQTSQAWRQCRLCPLSLHYMMLRRSHHARGGGGEGGGVIISKCIQVLK